MVEYKEYKIEVLMTPHPWDNEKEPYFWVILGWHKNDWVNTGYCGWAENPEKAWEQARKAFDKK